MKQPDFDRATLAALHALPVVCPLPVSDEELKTCRHVNGPTMPNCGAPTAWIMNRYLEDGSLLDRDSRCGNGEHDFACLVQVKYEPCSCCATKITLTAVLKGDA